LVHLNQTELNPATVEATLGVILKYQDDVNKVRGGIVRGLVEEILD
jgi:hypothetical protein